jgi:hypothetical protein
MLNLWGGLRREFAELVLTCEPTREHVRRYAATIRAVWLTGGLGGLSVAAWLFPGLDFGDWLSLRALICLIAGLALWGVGVAFDRRAYRCLGLIIDTFQAEAGLTASVGD